MSKLQEQKQKLYRDISICEKVRDTINSPGWQEIIGPKLQKMIESMTGIRDENGIWNVGYMDRRPNDLPYSLGYKSALMDFNNEVYNHIPAIEKAKASLVELDKQEARTETTTRPMEDTKYV